jgi:hypothetical protein
MLYNIGAQAFLGKWAPDPSEAPPRHKNSADFDRCHFINIT